ncbi:hypothetical protein PTKIN_Ptkin11bG0051100 [Pterospermum kingtungense]
MDYLEKLKAFLVSVISFLQLCPKLWLPKSPPPPPPPSVSPTSSIVDLESHQPPTLSSAPPSANDTETLQQEPPPSAIDVESSRPPTQPSAASPSTNYLDESPQPQQPPTPLSNVIEPEPILVAQQHLQWKNSVLSFCFSYALAVSLQFTQTDNQPDHLDSSFVLLSFLVLLTFNLILVASFISPSCTKTSEILEKVAFLVAAAAFCLATAIPSHLSSSVLFWPCIHTPCSLSPSSST